MLLLGQLLPKRDVRVTSVHPSISDIVLRRQMLVDSRDYRGTFTDRSADALY